MQKTKCATCKKYFSSTAEFDAHMVGIDPKRTWPKRHLSAEELRAKGWDSEMLKITDEIRTPIREVWFRKALREKFRLAIAAVKSRQNHIVACTEGISCVFT